MDISRYVPTLAWLESSRMGAPLQSSSSPDSENLSLSLPRYWGHHGNDNEWPQLRLYHNEMFVCDNNVHHPVSGNRAHLGVCVRLHHERLVASCVVDQAGVRTLASGRV